MKVSREEVLRIAQLAELDVDEAALPGLVQQMSQILQYISQLADIPASDAARPFTAGPDALRLRPDEVRPWPLAFPPADIAPAFQQGLFIVPRLGQFEDEGEGA
jgi:aspartyl-tRNA(Asn)/glutamyl-tRNA(Gln) amidotransferase subunit C